MTEKPSRGETKTAAFGTPDTLFAIVTHKFDRAICRNIDRIHDQLGQKYKLAVHYDATSTQNFQLPRLNCQVRPFNFEKVRTKFPHLAHAGVVPGNQYATYIELLPVFPDIKYFWFVEYDARFSGNWRTLVDACSQSDADMLGCHIRTKEEIPDWEWWSSIRSMHEPQKQLAGIRAYTWVVRLSRRALELVAQRSINEGWVGHQEGLLPSLLSDAGMRIEEIGGRGPFTPQERRGLYYSSEYGISWPSRNGDFGLGSNRYGPALLLWGLRKNRLYHPVKTNRRLETIRRDLWALLRYKKHSTLDFSKRATDRGRSFLQKLFKIPASRRV